MTPTRLRNLRGKVPMQVVGTGACTLARMRQGLFGAPLADLIVAGELPHCLASIFAYVELDGSFLLHIFNFCTCCFSSYWTLASTEHISHSNVIQSYGFSTEKKRLQNLLDLGTELNLGEYSLNTVASALQAFFRYVIL